MLKEKVTKVKNFVVDHKKEIAIVAGLTVGGIVVYKILKSVPKGDERIGKIISDVADTEFLERIEKPVLSIGTVDDIWKDQWGTSIILNDFTVGDMGKIGEEFLKIDGVTNDTVVTAMLGLLDKVESVVEI